MVRRWVKWVAAVLVPVVVYVGAYVGCCHFPRKEPAIFAANFPDSAGRGRSRLMKTVFAPLLAVHGSVVETRMARFLEGVWVRADGGDERFEFEPMGDGRMVMEYFKDGRKRLRWKGVISWVAGTPKVGEVLMAGSWQGAVFEKGRGGRLIWYPICASDVHRSRVAGIEFERVGN